MGSVDFLATVASLAELWCTRHGLLPPQAAAHARLQALVRHARTKSPLYRELYRGLPDDVALRDLPSVAKAGLMSRFDEWVTDPHVGLRDLRAFLADPTRVGARYLDRYHAWTSSGTSGVPGIFLQDAHAMAVYDALVAAQLENVPWARGAAARILATGNRAALVAATGGHYASIASWERLRRALPGLEARSFSILAPLAETAAALGRYRPGFLAGYPSILAMLAAEQQAGRLAIAPALVWSGGEHLARATARAIEGAFGCPVMEEYGASECLSIASGCAEGWLHVNSEWVIVEGVEHDGRATPPGELSQTTLLTNLANWVQPVIRYDLGDRIVAHAGPCRCGDPRPAIRVEGRVERLLRLRAPDGHVVRLAPLAVATVVEQAVAGHAFQVAQTGPASLALRVQGGRGKALDDVRARAAQALGAYLAAQSLPGIDVRQDDGAPRRDPRSGKVPEVVVESGRPASAST